MIYSAPVQEKTPPRSRSLEGVVCVWIVAAQIWYYAQFREQFRSILQSLFGRLWY
jgi:hypothetical protein